MIDQSLGREFGRAWGAIFSLPPLSFVADPGFGMHHKGAPFSLRVLSVLNGENPDVPLRISMFPIVGSPIALICNGL